MEGRAAAFGEILTQIRHPIIAENASLLSTPPMSNEAVVHAYRHLYRQSLRAIQFSKPARFTLRDRLRLAFRKGSLNDFEPQKIKSTLKFLEYATKENGLEHKIVKNLLHVWWDQAKGGRAKFKSKVPSVYTNEPLLLHASDHAQYT